MKFIYLLLCIVLIISCNQKQTSFNKFLNEGHLASQIFSVNINSDTTLITRNGCIIKIPKGSLESSSSDVKLVIKEAITPTDMVLAGLTTQSNGQALSSGGMIYFNAASGYEISIKRSLEVLVPTNSYNRDMQVYKGEKDENDKINWQDPEPLPKDSTIAKINEGEAIFNSYCWNCHKVYDELTGPALYGITEKRNKQWLYVYTRHRFAAPLDTAYQYKTDSSGASVYFYDFQFDHEILDHHECLQSRYGSEMPQYPMLSDTAIDNIYAYIKTESDKRPDLQSRFGRTCCDSCAALKKMYREDFEREKANTSEEFIDLDREIPLPDISATTAINTDTTANLTPYSKVNPGSATATYYSINISAEGWYNIDILLKDLSACSPSELFVRIQGNYKVDLNVALIIPSVKAFIAGGKIKDNEQYGFDDTDGKIPLPQNTKAYILAFGESDGKLIFGKTEFNTGLKQAINITVEGSTKEKMIAAIKTLNLDGVSTAIERSVNTDLVTETVETINQEEKLSREKAIKEIEKLRPKNCNCGPQTNPLPAK